MFYMQVALIKALADETRLSIFERLCRREHTVGDLNTFYEVSQPAISQHLRILRRCNLVRERRDGRFVNYRATPEGLLPLFTWLDHYKRFWPERLNALNTMLKEMPDDGRRKN